MAEMHRVALTSEHRSRKPVAVGPFQVSSQYVTRPELKHEYSVLTLTGDYRYRIRVEPADVDHLIDCLARAACCEHRGVQERRLSETLRDLADRYEAQGK